jgi:hypothetical protein
MNSDAGSVPQDVESGRAIAIELVAFEAVITRPDEGGETTWRT